MASDTTLDHIPTINTAREHFEMAARSADAGIFDEAQRAYTTAARTAAEVWQNPQMSDEGRTIAARLTADAIYAAGMASTRQSPPATEPLREATLLGITIYETSDLEDDVRLHGLYRAQCAAFELGHAMLASDPEQATELFQDAVGCIGALPHLDQSEPSKVARLHANASAASYALAGLLRDQDDNRFKSHLKVATEHGQTALKGDKLPPQIGIETRLLMSDATYELALTEQEQPKALELLQQALGWARDASQAPGADALMQADALLRGARYACVYGLYLRHTDFEGGIDALQGAVSLAVATAEPEHLPTHLRTVAYDTAVRTQQNIGLLLKQNKSETERACTAFQAAADMAIDFAQIRTLPEQNRAEMLYLAANARLEQAILSQVVAESEQHAPALKLFDEVKQLARNTLRIGQVQPDTAARAALLACGASGRILRAADPGEETIINRELEAIETFGQRASSLERANRELRARGAFFAADAAEKLAERASSPAAADEARHRAAALSALHRSLNPEQTLH